MRIAILSELFYPHIAGCERRFFEIGTRLAKRGHDIHVFTIKLHEKTPTEEQINGINIHRIINIANYLTNDGLRSPLGVLNYSFKTAQQLISSNFDVYYSNEWPLLHSLVSKPFIEPLIQEWCEIWFHDWRIVLLEKILMKLADHHVSVSNFTKQRLLQLGLSPNEISVIPNGVNYKKLSQNCTEKKWGRIIYIGRLNPHKNIEMLLHAFSKIQSKNSESELHIVGDGPLRNDITRQAGKINNCHVHGFLSENKMVKLLQSSWLFLTPSQREGSGIAALEAMATATPVITLDFPNNATKEFVNDSNGLVVYPNIHSISQAVLKLLEQEEKWKNLSANAKHITKNYDWDIITDQMENYCRKVI